MNAGVITDDHEWIVFGSNDHRFPTKVIEVYKFNGQEYVPNQNLFFNTTYGVRDIDMTQDHLYLVVGI